MSAKTVDAALDLEAQLGADRVRSEQVKWFRAGLEAAAEFVGAAGYPNMTRLAGDIRSIQVPEDV